MFESDNNTKLHPNVLQRLNNWLIDNVHTISYTPELHTGSFESDTINAKSLNLFDHIIYKMCFLCCDIKKIKMYI